MLLHATGAARRFVSNFVAAEMLAALRAATATDVDRAIALLSLAR